MTTQAANDVEMFPIRKLEPDELERCLKLIREGAITEVYVEWWGAVGENEGESARGIEG